MSKGHHYPFAQCWIVNSTFSIQGIIRIKGHADIWPFELKMGVTDRSPQDASIYKSFKVINEVTDHKQKSIKKSHKGYCDLHLLSQNEHGSTAHHGTSTKFSSFTVNAITTNCQFCILLWKVQVTLQRSKWPQPLTCTWV